MPHQPRRRTVHQDPATLARTAVRPALPRFLHHRADRADRLRRCATRTQTPHIKRTGERHAHRKTEALPGRPCIASIRRTVRSGTQDGRNGPTDSTGARAARRSSLISPGIRLGREGYAYGVERYRCASCRLQHVPRRQRHTSSRPIDRTGRVRSEHCVPTGIPRQYRRSIGCSSYPPDAFRKGLPVWHDMHMESTIYQLMVRTYSLDLRY